MISGQACTLGYTGEIWAPFSNTVDVVAEDSIRHGGFSSGGWWGGIWQWFQSRSGVVAHQGAGIQLVIAESFQRCAKRIWSILTAV